MDAFLLSKTALIFAGGLTGGGIGALLWWLFQKRLPRALLWLFVGGFAFLGARLLPVLISYTFNAPSQPSSPELSDLDEVTPTSPNPEGGLTATGQNFILPLDHPLISTLIDRDPTFETEVEKAIGLTGRPEQEVRAFAMTQGVEAALTYLPRANDQVIIDFVESFGAMVQAALTADPQACYGWLYGAYGFEAFDYARFETAVSIGLIDYQTTILSDMVRDAGEEAVAYDRAAAGEAVKRANFALLQTAGVERAGLISGQVAPASEQDYQTACAARLTLLQSILAEDDPASAIRHLFDQQ